MVIQYFCRRLLRVSISSLLPTGVRTVDASLLGWTFFLIIRILFVRTDLASCTIRRSLWNLAWVWVNWFLEQLDIFSPLNISKLVCPSLRRDDAFLDWILVLLEFLLQLLDFTYAWNHLLIRVLYSFLEERIHALIQVLRSHVVLDQHSIDEDGSAYARRIPSVFRLQPTLVMSIGTVLGSGCCSEPFLS